MQKKMCYEEPSCEIDLFNISDTVFTLSSDPGIEGDDNENGLGRSIL